MIIPQSQNFSKKYRFWQVGLSTGNEPLGSETSKLLHQTGECVLSLLQLTENFNLKNPWYSILAKRGTPVKISNLVFSSDISSREVWAVVWRYTHNY